MLLWIILGFGWLGVLAAGVSLFRLASYADRKVRRFTVHRLPERSRQTQNIDRAAWRSSLGVWARRFLSKIPLYTLGFTISKGGVEQVFRPAVKLTYPPASAAEVHRARIHHNL